MKINLKSDRSFTRRHVRFMRLLVRQNQAAYKLVMKNMIDEINTHLAKEKLAKSEGWTGDVAKISLNVDDLSKNVISKYMMALKWILLGDYAGKDAKKAAKKLDFIDKVVPGTIQASYLHSLDSNREYFKQLTGDNAEIPKYLIEGSLEQIAQRASMYIDQLAIQIENGIISALDDIVNNFNNNNLNKVHKGVLSGEEEESLNNIKRTLPKTAIDKELKRVVGKFENNWKSAADTEVGLASSAATHQAMYEIFGQRDDRLKVIILTAKNERVCDFCRTKSENPDGTFKIYSLSDFKPSGYNIGRKRKDWDLCIPKFHINCFCQLIYVPQGFTVNSNGELIKEKK